MVKLRSRLPSETSDGVMRAVTAPAHISRLGSVGTDKPCKGPHSHILRKHHPFCLEVTKQVDFETKTLSIRWSRAEYAFKTRGIREVRARGW
jgi:hypothetical protein